MDYKESKKLIDRLRNGEKVKCPECGDGIIMATGDPKTTSGFNCSNEGCRFAIRLDYMPE